MIGQFLTARGLQHLL